MRQFSNVVHIQTRGQGLYEATDDIVAWCKAQGVANGLLTVFCRHTSASLLIQENAASTVRKDLQAFFDQIAPEQKGRYLHDEEGPDDMPAHLRAALTQTSLTIPLLSGRLTLGVWQGIFLFEHRRAPHRREIVLHLLGD